MHVRCESCGGRDIRTVSVRPGLDYWRCCSCWHMLQVHQGRELIGRFCEAQSKYYVHSKGHTGERSDILTVELTLKHYEIFRRFVSRSATVLEVGPGSGEFLRMIINDGTLVTGVEESAALAANLNELAGVSIVNGVLEDSGLPTASHDALCSFHVIEHVPDPQLHLVESARIVRPGGLAILATPNARSWQQCVFPTLSPNLDSAHLRVFSSQSLRTLAERSGWEVIWECTPEYSSGWLRVMSKVIRRVRGQDEEVTAGRYWSGAPALVGILVRAFRVVSLPLRLVQDRCHGGNELVLVLRRACHERPT